MCIRDSSTTKYMDGHGASVGGAIVDSGKFDWTAHADKFPGLCEPDESYHGVTYTERFGLGGAFITKATTQLMRDFGAIQSPQNAYLVNLGLESLHLRMAQHSKNGLALAQHLACLLYTSAHRQALMPSPSQPGCAELNPYRLVVCGCSAFCMSTLMP